MARKALLVGINNYKGVNDLMGCVNDITNLRDVLKTQCGFNNEEIRLLADARATKANILSRLHWLVRGAQPGDTLVFQFSGHGSQVRDRDGDELADHLDEIICPYDMDWDGTYITDDMLNTIFRRLSQGVQLEVIMDSCHSGTGLRAVEFGRQVELGQDTPLTTYRKARYLPPPPDVLARVEGEEREMEPTRRFADPVNQSGRQILWAGCRADQTSADACINGAYAGAFTYFFCQQLREEGGTATRMELLQRVRQSLARGGYSQVPQLDTDATQRSTRAFTTTARPGTRTASGRTVRRTATANGRSEKKPIPTAPKRSVTLKLAKQP